MSLFGSLALVLLAGGVPIFFVLGLTALAVVIMADLPLVLLAHRFYSGLNSFTLMAIPFFILAGLLMDAGGLSRRIVDFSMALIGWVTGSLLMVAIVAATALAAMSGSGSADTAAVSAVLQPELRKRGYNVDFAAALISVAGTLAQIIPPSLMLVLIGVINNQSIGALFLAGILPGLLVLPGLFFIAYRHAIKGGPQYRASEAFDLGRLGRTFVAATPAFGLAVIIMGGILGGIFTPTEASGVAVGYALFVGAFIYRELTWKRLHKAFVQASAFTAGILILVAAASTFNWLIANAGVPEQVEQWFATNITNVFAFLLIVNLLLMGLGMVMESLAIILLLSPILLPIALSYGLHPVHFSVVVVFNCAIGMVTPPLGGAVFVAATIAQRPFLSVVRHVFKPWVWMTIVLLIITFIPEITLILPRMAGYID
ncbi:TRAP transporter large permease [Tateyamaria pelophila]|uniref:TRAP transporter large permease n=1 Tax=Tateyamaria pelophila TaxID=328415 RepID=UPI001CBADFF1|nr:TRAP transporter large permease [Tateyamaria pelophila]